MVLIADSGSTKTDWCCVGDAGSCVYFSSEGYNPNYITHQYMVKDIVQNVPKQLECDSITEIYFYGAGVTELQYGFVEDALREIFVKVKTVFVAMDLLASARALLGHKGGFASILGTGTNSCLYDGERETLNIDSLGFILGDEGSGGYIGKRLICDYVRGDMPENLREKFAKVIQLSGDEILDQIYTKPFPNRFCAQYCKYVGENLKEDAYYYNLVIDSFRDFFKNIISHYPNYNQYAFNCVGSVGYYFQAILITVAEEYGMKIGRIMKSPMQGLLEFHCPQFFNNKQ